MAVTKMMQQYLNIKETCKDAILFYRLGDFYEMFYEDAEIASKELELTLTGKNCGDGERAPMCGVPFHSVDQYIGKLVNRGYKVVICEQLEDPAVAKDLVERGIVRVITPGTIIDNTQLAEEKNNYLCALYFGEENIGIGFIDVSTGEASAAVFKGDGKINRVINDLGTYMPSEIITNTYLNLYPAVKELAEGRIRAYITEHQPERFDYIKSLALATKAMGTGVRDYDREVICAVGALLSYIAETQKTDISNISKLNVYEEGQYLGIDISTRRNLELCNAMRTGDKKGTLLWVLDRTKTAAGARMLRRWVELPLINSNQINRRQAAVAELASLYMQREEVAAELSRVLDLDRLITKLIYGTASARDLKAISATASVIPSIKSLISECKSDAIASIYKEADDLSDICELIENAIVDDLPITMRDGGYIKRGYSKEADELFEIKNNGEEYIHKIENEERQATGIKNLRISYNRVFGYYIEVTNSNINDVPDRYIRKQTLTNCERYITEELKQKETVILGAADKLSALEYELFSELREKIASQAERIQRTASLLAELDCYVSLADVAVRNDYCRPEVDYGSVINIKEGRHPVVEKFTKNGYFVPNDTILDTNYNRLALITGPNMAGKSTYMRQVALITLMAQIGSFVPAKEAHIGIVDKIFTRVGASDDLASGQSTFMLEMTEVAYILKNATIRSLIVMDEIGRGTSTFDGMSIAKAVAEYIAGKKIGAKTMFATHYHELTELEGEIPGIINYNIAAKKKGDEITFLRKIVRGGTDDSYGIEVAKLAGVPNEVISKAKTVLKELESKSSAPVEHKEHEPNSNISIDDFKADDVRKKLLNTDVNLLTPLEALNLVYELKRLAE